MRRSPPIKMGDGEAPVVQELKYLGSMLSESFKFDQCGRGPTSRLDSESAMSGMLLTSPMAAVASAPSDAECPAPWAGGGVTVAWP